MTKYSFADQAGSLLKARSALMAPHRAGEEKSFIDALSECRHTFKNFDEVERVESQNARDWIETIKRFIDKIDKRFIDKTDVQASHEGLIQYIRTMDLEEKCEFSNAVDELANWFNGKSSSETES